MGATGLFGKSSGEGRVVQSLGRSVGRGILGDRRATSGLSAQAVGQQANLGAGAAAATAAATAAGQVGAASSRVQGEVAEYQGGQSGTQRFEAHPAVVGFEVDGEEVADRRT